MQQKAFLSILSDYIANRPTHLGDSIDWNEMLDIAKKHQLTNIIIEQCENAYIDAGMQKRMLNYFMASMAVRARQEKIIFDVTSFLNENDIPYCIVKGKPITKYYHKPEHRSMGDVDLVLKSDDREKIHDYLLSMGFENISKNINHEWVYKKGNYEIEIHDKLIYPEVFNKESEEKFFNNFWPHVKDNELEMNFHFLYLINHLKKHLTSTGAGFRQFIDLCMVLKHCPEFDKDLVIEYLKESDMYEFARVVFLLCSYWFNDETLYFFNDGLKLGDDVLESKTKTIFENGVFGQYNKENKANVSVNNLRYSRFKFVSKIRILLIQFFPSYTNMLAMSRYAFLQNRPYLLPFAWAYRAFINIKNIKSFFEEKIKFASSAEQEKREKDLEQWNII